MIVVRTYKSNACYLAGKIINIPYVIFQRDRRKRDIPVEKNRREVALIGLN